ncbi:hypothetical protein BH23PLA1_BH23PLA1_18740 [soil metagenome]
MRCSLSTVYNLCGRGLLRHHRIGLGRGAIRIPEPAIAEYLESSSTERAPARETPRHLRL